jgi:hypothetical protein
MAAPTARTACQTSSRRSGDMDTRRASAPSTARAARSTDSLETAHTSHKSWVRITSGRAAARPAASTSNTESAAASKARTSASIAAPEAGWRTRVRVRRGNLSSPAG